MRHPRSRWARLPAVALLPLLAACQYNPLERLGYDLTAPPPTPRAEPPAPAEPPLTVPARPVPNEHAP